ncbi:MAG: HAD family hydrolase [Phenylobacterium sp.]
MQRDPAHRVDHPVVGVEVDPQVGEFEDWRQIANLRRRSADHSAIEGSVTQALRPALFLDRDGVLNEDLGYVSRWEDFRFIPGAARAVAAANAAGWLVIVVTNQSGIGRGYYTEADMHALHARMNAELAAQGARIDAIYHCPQHPHASVEAYRHPDPPGRKPNPGMLLQAIADHAIDPARSLMVGDKPADMEAARRAGVRGLLVEGGDLFEAVRPLLSPEGG